MVGKVFNMQMVFSLRDGSSFIAKSWDEVTKHRDLLFGNISTIQEREDLAPATSIGLILVTLRMSQISSEAWGTSSQLLDWEIF